MTNYFTFHSNYVWFLNKLLTDDKIKTDIKALITVIKRVNKHNKTIYFCGNGGHAATSNHFACDLSTVGIRAVSLTANSSEVTRLGNDFGYDRVFDKQLNLERGDAVVGISASGNSMNVVNALKLANEQRAHSIAMVGFADGGKAKEMAAHTIHIKTPDGMYGLVEDAHMTICHMIAVFFKDYERVLYSKARRN